MAENENIILTNIEVTETNEPVQIDETIQVIEFDSVNAYEIEADDAFAAIGEPNIQLRHSLLTELELPNQHPIIAIEGLRQELDSIEALQTVYSDNKQQANYYMWHDENLAGDDRVGYFVSMHQSTAYDSLHGTLSCIEICNGDQDVFGVTVANAGFIGGQEYSQAIDGDKVGRNHKYGLVVHSGITSVKCESDVAVGDYVVPNNSGVAKKSAGNYGYLVTALGDINGECCAVISLTMSSKLAQTVANSVDSFSERMDSAEYNIASVTNVANSAYAMAQDAQNITATEIESIKNQVGDVVGKVESMGGTVSELDEKVTNTAQVANQAKEIAQSAKGSADAMRTEAVAKATEASENISKLIDELAPITQWRDPTTGNTGAEYLTTYINNGLATKVEVQTASTKAEEAWSATEQNAKQLQSLAQTIDKYSVGEHSQAYGLTHEQAKAILPIGLVYVPTFKHEEIYDTYTQEFLKGYHYTWNGEYWEASKSVSVAFSNVYMAGTEGFYWVVTDQDIEVTNADGEVTATYDLGGLYLYKDGAWEKVASTVDNTMSRTISAIRQTADSISMEIVDIKGDVASNKQWIDGNSANIQSVVTWKNDVETDVASIATIKQTANDAGASIAQVVEAIGKDGEVNAASIVTAINSDTGEGSASIKADKINFEGFTTFVRPDDLGEGGTTTIDGSRITTGTIDTDRLNVLDIITVGTDSITTITNDTISTTDVYAKNLQVEGANVKNLQANSIIVAGDKTVQDFIDNSIDSITVYYAVSNSTKIPPEDDAWGQEVPEKEGKLYMWQKTVTVYGDGSIEEVISCVDGKGHIVIDITCSTGTIYINNEIQATLTAKVLQDNQDITSEFPSSAFRWEKYDMYGNKDTVWSYTGTTVVINNLDIYKRAMFNCILDVEQRL